jgi:nucleoid DNA-binding protein
MKRPMTKIDLAAALLKFMPEGSSRRDAGRVLDGLAQIAHAELKSAGLFALPGMARFVAKIKPAVRAGSRPNPFTGQPCKGCPARRVVRVRATKNLCG